MKQLAKSFIVRVLGWQTRRLANRHSFKVIAVAGSVGKTSTKFAIAQLLGDSFRVRYQEGNYNDIITVPLVYFGHALPSLFNPIAWLRIVLLNELQIRRSFSYDVVVLELGVDGPGQLQRFKDFVAADVGVLTAIAPEHMEFFADLDAVAREELVLAELSGQLLYNRDLCSAKYMVGVAKASSYDQTKAADYKYSGISDAQRYSVSAAISVAERLGLSQQEIQEGIKHIQQVSGRMQLLTGINGSQIIDETYNASPDAVKSALRTLYAFNADKKIALLGNMNELGAFSPDAHKAVGEACDPDELELVVTLGPDANKYLADAATERGCKVIRCTSPYEAGNVLQPMMTKGAVLLAKGSQNGVFAEEAVKLLLADSEDTKKLVRQSPHWQSVKAKQFKDMA